MRARIRQALRSARARRGAEVPDLSHLALFDETPNGPLQRDEALLLYSLVRVIRPQTVVEVGFLRGRSALNCLRALDPDARLYSFDIDPACEQTARDRFGHDPRFRFRVRSQDEVTAGDLDGRPADLVFIDGAHDLALNKATFERLLPLLSERALIAVHDTGAIPREVLELPDDHWMLTKPEIWAADAWEHQPDERAFVNWILEQHPEFAQIHVHSAHAIRAGLTLLQRGGPLPRPPGEA